MARVFKQTYTKNLPEGAEVIDRDGRAIVRFRNAKGRSATGTLSHDGLHVRFQESKGRREAIRAIKTVSYENLSMSPFLVLIQRPIVVKVKQMHVARQ